MTDDDDEAPPDLDKIKQSIDHEMKAHAKDRKAERDFEERKFVYAATLIQMELGIPAPDAVVEAFGALDEIDAGFEKRG